LQYFYIILFPLSCSDLHFVNKTISQHYKKKTKCHKNRTFADTLIFQGYKYAEYLQTEPPYAQKSQEILEIPCCSTRLPTVARIMLKQKSAKVHFVDVNEMHFCTLHFL